LLSNVFTVLDRGIAHRPVNGQFVTPLRTLFSPSLLRNAAVLWPDHPWV